MSAWVLTESSGFLPHSKKHVKLELRLTGHSEWPVVVNVSVDSCFSLYVSPAMNWRLVQGDPAFAPRW